MTSVAPDRSVFSTPWHWFVHGLGMGQNRTGFDAARAARIRTLASTVARHRAGRFPKFVAHLVDVIVAACDPADGGESCDAVAARLAEQIATLGDPREHARAVAAATESLVMLGRMPPGDHALRRELGHARNSITALPASSDHARYGNLHLLANVVVAGAQAGWPEALGQAQLDAAVHLLGPIDDFFYHGRALALWQTVVGVLEPRARDSAGDALRQLLDQLDLQLQRRSDRPGDGMHEGRDYVVFPLLLTLAALGPVRRLDLLHQRRRWLDVAAAELFALSPRARASQTLFYIAMLRSLGALPHEVPDPAGLVRATAAQYLAATDGRQVDDYLRSTYLVHLAHQLGCAAVLPDRIGVILADSPTQLDVAGPFRDTPYGSPLLLVGYVLSALHTGSWPAGHALYTLDLASVVRSSSPRSDDAVNLPRLGLGLIDAALCLASPTRSGWSIGIAPSRRAAWNDVSR
jgi:hypothetical protein